MQRVLPGKGTRMRSHASFCTCLALLLLSTPAWGATTALSGPGDFGPSTVIDFDAAAHGTAANTLYSSLGVEFEYDELGSPVPIIDWTVFDPPRATTSAPNVLSTEDGVNGSVFSDFLDVVFSTTVTQVGAWFGNDQGLSSASFPVTLSVFDAGDILLGSTQVLTNQNVDVDQFIGIESDDPITRARFQYTPLTGSLSVVIDDVIFNAVPVPEPTTASLLALGLIGLGARRRS